MRMSKTMACSKCKFWSKEDKSNYSEARICTKPHEIDAGYFLSKEDKEVIEHSSMYLDGEASHTSLYTSGAFFCANFKKHES